MKSIAAGPLSLKRFVFAFGLRLRSKTRCFKTRVLGSLVAVSKPVFQRKHPA